MLTYTNVSAMKIGRIAKKVPSVGPKVKSKEVDRLFSENPNLRGIVVVEDEKPIGHITRTHFYQKIGTLYGYNLYMGRESKLVAKTNPLIVDYDHPIVEVSRMAMEREEEDLYDDVIVTKNGEYVGVVSIRALLNNFVEIQVELASFLNPLSNLPGNHIINQKLLDTLSLERYSIIYFDLDSFKAYNDLYGFNQGDKVILHLTDILKEHLMQFGYFLGHIGGDDFMAIVPHYNVESICEAIIDDFDQTIPSFYDEKHLADLNLKIKDRSGKLESFSIMSLSIAVLTNKERNFNDVDELSNTVAEIKRNCKKVKGSIYLVDEYELDKV
ncbi:GGDEF domain-containing protein [Ureibacillus thermosphaericus]